MPGIVRLGDIGSGHGCYPPMVNTQASPDVFVNSIGCHRVGDSWASHCCVNEPYDCHSSVAAIGSSTVFANGKAVCRAGDSVACGSTMVGCSGNVFAG